VSDPVVAGMREEIAALDVRLVDVVNARIKVVEKLRRYKAHHGLAFVDPEREAWLLQHLKSANGGPLSDAGLEELVSFVLGLVKQEVAHA
jgi:chorismate mutase